MQVHRESRALPVMSWLPGGERVREAAGGTATAHSRLTTTWRFGKTCLCGLGERRAGLGGQRPGELEEPGAGR